MSLARVFELGPEHAGVVLGSLRAVVEASGPIDSRGSEFLATCATTLELSAAWPSFEAVVPGDAAECFADPRARTLLIHALIVAACVDTRASTNAVLRVREFADALDVRTPWLPTLVHASRRRVLPVKLALARRSPDALRLFRRIWAEEGLLGLVRALRFVVAGGIVDPVLARRFRLLAELPQGSFGRSFWESMAERRLAFPGERGGLPERMIHHDLMHVLTGYGTDPAGECELAGFYAGFSEGEPFTFVMTALATFQLGLPVSPAVVKPARGAFDATRVIAAFERGRRLHVDVMGPWDYWSLMPLPIAEVRARLGIGES
jgi:hypothetical protein